MPVENEIQAVFPVPALDDDFLPDHACDIFQTEPGDGFTTAAKNESPHQPGSFLHAVEAGLVAEKGANDDGRSVEHDSQTEEVVDLPCSNEERNSAKIHERVMSSHRESGNGSNQLNKAGEIAAGDEKEMYNDDFVYSGAEETIDSTTGHSERTENNIHGARTNAFFQSTVAPGAFRIPGPGFSENHRSLADSGRVSMVSVQASDAQSSAIITNATLVTSSHRDSQEVSSDEVVVARGVFKRDGLDCNMLLRDRRVQSFLCIIVAVIVALSVTLSRRSAVDRVQSMEDNFENFVPTPSPIIIASHIPSSSPTVSAAPILPTAFPTYTQAPTIGFPGYISSTKQMFQMVLIAPDKYFSLEGTRRTAFESIMSSFSAQYGQGKPGLVQTECSYIGIPSGRGRSTTMHALNLVFSLTWSSKHFRTESYPDDFVRYVDNNADAIYQELVQGGIEDILAINGITKMINPTPRPSHSPTSRPSHSPTPRPTVTQAPTLTEASIINGTYSLVIYVTNPNYTFGTEERMKFCTLMEGYTTSFGPNAGMKGHVGTSCQILNDPEVYRESGTVYSFDVRFGMRWESIHTNVSAYAETYFRYVQNHPYSIPDDLVEHGVMERSDSGGIDQIIWESGAPGGAS